MSALAGVPVGSTASVRQLRVAGTGLQPRLHDKTTRRTDPAGSTLATPDFGPKDGVHLIATQFDTTCKGRSRNPRRHTDQKIVPKKTIRQLSTRARASLVREAIGLSLRLVRLRTLLHPEV